MFISIVLYSATALVVGAALFVFAEFKRAPGTPAPRSPGLWGLAAGFLWPVLLFAAAQFALVLAVGRRRGHAAAPSGDAPTRVAHPVS